MAMMSRPLSIAVLLATALAPSATLASGIQVPSALRQKAEAGNAVAEVKLAGAYSHGQSNADKVAAAEWWRKAALQGNATGAWRLGAAYLAASGVPHDPAKGLQWMRKGIAGSPERMFVYAADANKFSDRADTRTVVLRWFRRSAQAGFPAGMFFAATLDVDPQLGARRDVQDAQHWQTKMAETGNPLLEAVAGALFLGEKEPTTAVRWMTKAADAGLSQAQGMLAAGMMTGKNGFPIDPRQAVAWADKAVVQHNALGYYALGIAYQDGRGGMPVNPAKAWYNFAAAQHTDTDHELTHVAARLSQAADDLSASQISKLQVEVAGIPMPACGDGINVRFTKQSGFRTAVCE